MDIRAQIRRNEMDTLLCKFAKRAEDLGASDAEAMVALIGMAGTIYAVQLSGAKSEKEINAARRVFVLAMQAGYKELPSKAQDEEFDEKLKDMGL